MSRRGSAGGPDGIAVIDKPAGWTSHDVVAKSRGIIGTRKIGHSGTLDPDATGVLVLGIGRATRVLRFLQLLPKTYEVEIVFGVETNTLDASGRVTASHEMGDLRFEDIRRAATGFLGRIEQVPPMVSAVKIDGRRLHELAREGIEVEREPRPVTIYRFEVSATADPLVVRATVECSAGTYVRTLAADLGAALGGGAHIQNLRRTAVGSFTLADSHPLDTPVVLPMSEAMRGFRSVTVDGATESLVRVGSVLTSDLLGVDGAPPWAVLGEDGSLLAVYEPHRDGIRVKPAVVLVG